MAFGTVARSSMRRAYPPRLALRPGDDSSVPWALRSESRLAESAARADRL